MDEDTKTVSMNPADWPDNLPPCLIYVDKEGCMWHNGAAMIHEGINRLLTDHVELDEKHRYVINFQGQRCFVEVEDTLFVIVRFDHKPAEKDSPEKHLITLNDGSQEELDPSTLTIGSENVLYAHVKSGRFPARFLRRAYYQMAEYVVERGGSFVLPYRGVDYAIQ
ncbi:MAG: DUF1285 domain-containing protein [Deltaproteobacteria bacterium]|nr:DUF1285 domain-containing protein [Deltaproteobacteria bacterium]MBW2052827.1 DUF1285 domain-containing protein [Deltaproteobacteria bacterium]MBW2140519.1 DUF1285 domain-containing protein [Deltaproteobacteria bacterium]MBW2324301.1 DUF1285 domain-containing protein [Deltaproteobacteria bacterium]